VAVITHGPRQFKMSVKGKGMFPTAALVDPDLLVTLPAPLVASTGFDALTHAVEAFTVRPSGFITDTLALEAVRLIFRHLPQAYQDIRENGPARAGMMRGSLLAGMAFGNSDVGAVHCLAEALGSIYDTPHGVANAVFLPYVMEFNLAAAAAKYADIAAIVGVEETSARGASRRLIRMIKELSRTLAIPTFQELGIPEADFPVVARKAFQNNSNPSNPREAGEEDYLEILRNAFLEV
jgi:alcohol dehydrogenase